MTTSPDLTIPEEDIARQAVASLRGYAYQVWASALAWTELKNSEVLLLEVAEDFSLLSSEALALKQSKDTAESGSVTLRTKGVVDAINSLWRYQEANQTRAVTLVYLTTSSVGREQKADFPDGLPGLIYWRQAARDGVNTAPLRDFLKTLALEPELKAWLETADETEFRRRILQRIRWECGQPSLTELDVLLDEALILLCETQGAPPSSAKVVRDVVLVDLLRAATNGDAAQRRRTRSQLLELVERTTSISVPAGILQALMGGAGPRTGGAPTALEPLGVVSNWALTIERPDATDALANAITSSPGWLFGASGTGKTALASSIGRLSNRIWYIIDLRDLGIAEAVRRLRDARRELAMLEAVAGVVVDDLPMNAIASLKRELLLLRSQLDRSDAGLLIVSYKPPTPSLVGDLGLATGAVLEAPYFTENETSALIAAAGGDPSVWAKSVYLFCGGGHPQLVAARVAGLRSRSWQRSELLDILEASGPRDVEAEREAVRARLYDELPPDARTLLYRLSFLTGTFDRELAVALGASPPPVAEPGAVVDLLTGPWLEARPGKRLRVSPLVANAGAMVLAPDDATAVHRAISDILAARAPFPAEQLPQLLLSALISSHHGGLSIVVGAAFSGQLGPEELASTLFMLPLLNTDRPLVADNPGLNRMLRLAQLKVANREDDLERLLAIYRRFIQELDKDETEALQRSAAAWFLLSTDAPIPPSAWFEPLADLEAHPFSAIGSDLGQAIPDSGTTDELTDVGLDPSLLLFALRTTKLRGIDDLEAWFDALDQLTPERRQRYLYGLPEPMAGRRTALHMTWVRASTAPGFNPVSAAARFGALRLRADTWSDSELALECVCCQVVLLAEYANDSDGALALLEASESTWPGHVRLLRERAKILFSQRRFADVLASGTQLLSGVEGSDSVERTHVAREIALSAGETGDLSRAIELLSEAEQVAGSASALAEMTVGLMADRAFLVWRSGDRRTAMQGVRDAMLAAESLDAETERGKYVTRALSIVVRAMFQDLTNPGWERAFPTVYGIASRPPQEWTEGPPPNLLAAWYQLAEVERHLGMEVGISKLLAERTTAGRIVTFEYIQRSRSYLAVLQGDDPAAVVGGLSDFARASSYAKKEITRESDVLIDPHIFDVVQALPWDGEFDFSDATQSAVAVEALLVSAGFACARGADDWVERLKAVTTLEPEVARLLQSLASGGDLNANGPKAEAVAWALHTLASQSPSPADLYIATVRLWDWLGDTLLPNELAVALGPIAAERWRFVAEHGRFGLRAPTIHAPAILAASEGVADRAAIARLALSASGAVNINLPAALLQNLRRSAEKSMA